MSEAIAIAVLGLIVAFGARLIARPARTHQGGGRPVSPPFWWMMLLRLCLISAFAAILYFAEPGLEYRRYPEKVSAWGGAILIVIMAILIDATWASVRFMWQRRGGPR